MKKIMKCYEMCFTLSELSAIYASIQDRLDLLKDIFEGWYPLCDDEMKLYKERANELQILHSLELEIRSLLYSK